MNPSEELAAKILDRLEKKQLVSGSQRKRIADKLTQGKMKQEDWQAAIEFSLAEGEKHGS
ncbi:hypothetical protein [Azonexus sp.]|uniref:hypothetical protein n=1 Tax=Azonexus sp. TaxID=1872668 RepID=UPI0035AF2218